jgi:glycosyltransferase involved in cell wall biosynthesis
MRVVHIIKAVQVAGAEQHLLALLPGLISRGVDAQLILLAEPSRPMDDFMEMAAARHIPIQRLWINRHVDPSLFGRLRDKLRELKPDIAHTHLLHADLYGIIAARWARVPTILSSRHNDNAFRRKLPMRLLNWTLWRLASKGIAISEAIRRFCIEVEGVQPEKIKTIYYGLQPTSLDRKTARLSLRHELHLASEGVLIGIVCRLTEQKGITYGLQAFAHITREFPQVDLVIVGDGPLRSTLQDEAAEAGIQERTHFLGWRGDVPALMAGLDMLLAPSLWEGFGLVFLEAMNAQLPIIASAVSAIPEIIMDGETGLLVPPRDVDALVNALRSLLEDSALRQHMGLLGQDRLETHFSLTRMVDETAILYEQVMKR